MYAAPRKSAPRCIGGNGGAAQPNTTKHPHMKNIIVIIAAVLAVGISGCAHKKPAHACTDGKSCCAKKK